MKLEQLQEADSYKGEWVWTSHDEMSIYISVRAYPTTESAYAAYSQFIGEPWPDNLDPPSMKIVSCCDHDELDCFRNEADECAWAIERKVWAFEL